MEWSKLAVRKVGLILLTAMTMGFPNLPGSQSSARWRRRNPRKAWSIPPAAEDRTLVPEGALSLKDTLATRVY